jgi:hypothetical protein
MSDEDRDEEYRGEATLLIGERSLTVGVHLSARFEPVEGRYRWAGRAAADDDLLRWMRAGGKDVVVAIGSRPGVPARLGEPDPWGRVRLTGVGRPPW